MTVENGGTKHVKIVTVQKDGELAFDVTIDDKTVTVAPTAGGTEFSTLAFEGEGSVTKVAVAAVPTAIIPPTSGKGGTQDSGLVSKYVTWLNTADKGGAMQGASEAERSDAFAMNVGGMPKLEVVAIDPNSGDHGTITIKGSYTTSADTEQTADLGDINGKIYVTYSKTLDGTAQTAEATVALQDGETATINLPEGAVFVKARVALAQPTDTTL